MASVRCARLSGSFDFLRRAVAEAVVRARAALGGGLEAVELTEGWLSGLDGKEGSGGAEPAAGGVEAAFAGGEPA